MAKQIELTIPKPCHEDWDAMTPVERGRFCGACQKQVMDFTNMSDSQVAAFFKKKTPGSVCGHFNDEQLGRPMEIPKKRIPWVKYFFQFTLPLFIASLKTNAQKKGEVMVSKVEIKQNGVKPKVAIQGTAAVVVPDIEIAGTVITEDSKPVALATVMLKGSNVGVTTNTDGRFKINIPSWVKGSATLAVSYVGYESKEVVVSAQPGQDSLLVYLKPEVSLLDEVVITSTVSRRTVGLLVWAYTKITDERKVEVKTDPLPVTLFYPNPLPSGSAVNIKCENMEEDDYSLQLLTIAGQVAFSKELWIDKQARVFNIVLPRVAPGTYMLVLTSQKKQKRITEKIIILP
jgi:hypothetical protein